MNIQYCTKVRQLILVNITHFRKRVTSFTLLLREYTTLHKMCESCNSFQKLYNTYQDNLNQFCVRSIAILPLTEI